MATEGNEGTKTTTTTYFLQTLIAKRLKLMKLKPSNALLHAIQPVLKSKHARRRIVEKQNNSLHKSVD